MLYTALKTRGKTPPRVTIDQVKSLSHGAKLGGLMFVAGIATGLCGFGGGIYYMPVLTAVGYPMHIAIGTSSVQMIPVSLIGATNLTIHGYQNWLFMGTIGVVTLLFSWIGARSTAAMKAWLLKAIFGLLIGIIGILVAVGLI
jgi:Sulfite exporter TauE/SafE.